jgi:extradiol dioxygenase
VSIKLLGYIGIDTTALAGWREIAGSVLAFETVPPSSSGQSDALYLRMDELHHRVAVYPSSRDGLRHLGWQVDDQAALEECCARLERSGHEVVREPATVAAERAVRGLVSFRDPEGFRHEIYWGQRAGGQAYKPSRPSGGFVTGLQGLGHVVLAAADRPGLVALFQETFGFKLSDTITLHGVKITFLRCNPRHHTLAIMEPGLGVTAGEMHHVLFEFKELNDVGRAYDLVQENQVPLILTLGRHVNDHMVSFYFKSPSSVGIEVGYGARTVDDDTWVTAHYDYAGLWGHKLVG